MPEGGTDPVGEGLYPYILEAFFYRVDRKGKKERRRLIARSAAMTGTISVEAVLGPPVIDLVSPAEGAITTSGTITVAGTVTGEEPLTVTVSGNPVSLIDGAFSAESVLEEGPQVIEVRATDGSDRTVTVTRTVIRDSIAPVVQVVDPAPGSVIADPSPTIAIAYEDLGSGVVPSTLKVSVDETDVTTRFTPDPVGAVGTLPAGTILTDGEHQVLASVADAGGLVGAGLGVFTVDTTPPVLASVHPPAGAVLSTSMIRLSGVVLDLTPVEVEVNGIPAIMTGSEFVLEGLDLAEGANLIELTAVDVVGNRSTISHALVIDTQAPVVTLVSPAPDGAFRNRSVDLVFEVDDQTTTSLVLQGGGTSVSRVISPGSGAVTIPIELPADTTTGYTFHATDAAGNLSPVQTLELTHDETPPDPPVLFTRSIVTSNTRVGIDGCAEPGSTVEFLGGLGPTRTVAEEPMGKFSLEFDLGPDTTLTVRVRVIDAAGNTSAADEVRITQYTGTPPASVSSVVAVGGFAQQGLVGEALHQPLTVLVRTLDGLPLAGQDVLYRVMAGRMTLDGPTETQVTVRTDAAGRAGVTGFLSLDASVGDRPGGALVVATRPGPAGVPAIFDIAALPVRTDRPTSLSGYLEDSDERAIPGVEVHLHTPPFSTTVTDARGHFRFEDIPPGEHHFLLDGSTAALPGTYTDLVFKLECLPGQDNSLGMPIFLPRVDVDSGIDVSETEGGVLTNPELPGLEIHVAPGSATFPDGSNSGRLAVVAVPRDKTPMPFPEGLYGNFVIAVYPPGTHFDPPAKTIFPNVDPRLSPGDTAPLISFDHDVGDYVKVGTATVSPDGSRIISDPGYGIKVAAWHVTPPPDPPEYGCVEGRLKAPPGSCIVESECWTVNNRRLVNPVLGELPPGGVRVEICNVPRDELAGARLECRATSIRVEGPRQLVLDPLNADDQASTTPVVNRVYQVFSSDERFRSIRLVPEQDGVLTVTPSTVSGASPVMIESQGGAGRFRIRMIAPNGVVCDSVSVLVVPRILDLVRSTPAQGNFSVIRPDSLPLVLTQGGEVYFEKDLAPETTGLIKGTVFSTDAGGFKLRFSPVETHLEIEFFVVQAQPAGIAAGLIHPEDVVQTLEPGVDTLTVRYGDAVEDLTEPAIVQVRVADAPQGIGATLGYVVVSPPRIAAAGDSITAGFQAGFLTNPRQQNSYPSILQRLTRLNNIDRRAFLPHPLIGSGTVTDKNGNPLPIWDQYRGIQPDSARSVTLGLVRANNFPQENVKNAPRMNPHTQPFNLAVPGYNTEQIRDISALNHRDTLNSTVSQILYEDILGEGNPTFRKRPEASTQLDQIRTVAPSMLVLWAANNDFLGAVTETNVNPPNGVTPPDELYPTYTDLVMKAKKITPDVVLATVPDATAFPTFIPLTGKALGEGFFGYQIKLALANKTTLYETTPIPLTSAEGIDLQGAATSLNKYISAQRAMENPEVTHPIFVLDPKMKNALLPPEIAFIQSSIAQFNEVVLQVAAAQEVPVVRMDLLLDRLGTPPCRVITNVGEILPGLKGLLFSPDGIHATDLGYGLLAHAFRNGINGRIQLQGSFGGLTSTSQKHGPLPSTITVPTGCLE